MYTRNILTLLATALFSVTAFAGLSQPAPLTIEVFDDGSGFASGDMTTVRKSEDDVSFIGCGVRTFAGGYTFGFCQASLEDGLSYNCFTEDPTLLNAINSVSDFAFITFGWDDDGAGNLSCNRVGSSTQSFYLQAKKVK
jgi:hypothetical protein